LSLAQQDPPDLIFIKLMMPDLDGYEVCRRLKEMQGLKDIPIVLHSASPAKAKAPFAQLAGAAGYLEYPLDPKALLDTRDAALRGETYYPSLAEKSETES